MSREGAITKALEDAAFSLDVAESALLPMAHEGDALDGFYSELAGEVRTALLSTRRVYKRLMGVYHG